MLSEFLWPKGKEANVSYRLRELDSKLLTAANLARSSLGSRMSCISLTCLLRDVLRELEQASSDIHKDDLS